MTSHDWGIVDFEFKLKLEIRIKMFDKSLILSRFVFAEKIIKPVKF